MKKRILAIVVALALVFAMAIPSVFATPYDDPGVSTAEPIDLQFPWDAGTLISGNAGTFDLNLAIGAGALCAAVENGKNYAETVLDDLGLAGEFFHSGYGLGAQNVAHTFSLAPISVDGTDYNLITVIGRGSLSISDLLTDVTPGAFAANANVVLNNLNNFLASYGISLSDPANRFFVTGHSLGGAVANILVHELGLNGVAKSAIYGYTFGTPLTTSRTYAGRDNVFNFVGGSTYFQNSTDTFCWGSDDTFGKLQNLNMLSVALDGITKGRYGYDRAISSQSNAFKTVYQTLTGKVYENDGLLSLSRHLLTTYLAYALEGQDVTATVVDGIRVITINGGAIPVEPVTEPTEPVTEPTEPVTEPTEPVTEPTEPVTEPTEPVTEPTEPVTEPTEPVTEPTEPVTEPTEPVTEPTEPVTEPTEPVTEPSTEPVTEPVTQPTEPSTKPNNNPWSSGGGIFSIFTSIFNSISNIFRSIFRW